MVMVHDDIIVAIVSKLPPPGTCWPVEQRQRWLDLMEAAFDVVYEGAPVEARKAAVSKPEPNAIQEVLTDTHVLAVAVHVPEDQLQINTAEHEELDAKATETVTHDEDHRQILPRKNVGGAPSQIGRPEDIPSNYEMATEAIRAHDGAASGTQIRDYIKKKYWPGIAAHWTATLYDMVTSRKLARSGINFVVPEPSTAIAKPAVPKPAPKKVQLQPRVYAPHEKPEEFQWKDSTAILLSPKEYLLAAKLRAAMGKGHIGVQYLAENALGMRRGQGEEVKSTLRQMAMGMADRLASIGLAIEYHEGFGFLMKEVEVG